MENKKFSVAELVNNSGCFDLQFRKDTRHERTGSPTYYRWKIQFVITLPKIEIKTLQKAAREIGCGNITTAGNQARLSMQNIDEIFEKVVPYFTKNSLGGEKQKDFMAWIKAVEIVYKNKGKKISAWEKNDLGKLLLLHQGKGKWTDMAKTISRTSAGEHQILPRR